MSPATAATCRQSGSKEQAPLWLILIGLILIVSIFLPACTSKPSGNTKLQADPWQMHLFIDITTNNL